jgi:hypothetical protein
VLTIEPAQPVVEVRWYTGLIEVRWYTGLIEVRWYAGLIEVRWYAGLSEVLLDMCSVSSTCVLKH